MSEICFSIRGSTGDLICIKRGELGFFQSDWSTASAQQNMEIAEFNNNKLGVTPAQRKAMEMGSMYGWSVPAADPDFWESKLGREQHP